MVNEDLFDVSSNKLAHLGEEVSLAGSCYLAHMSLEQRTQTLDLSLPLNEQDRVPVEFELILKPRLDEELH